MRKSREIQRDGKEMNSNNAGAGERDGEEGLDEGRTEAVFIFYSVGKDFICTHVLPHTHTFSDLLRVL